MWLAIRAGICATVAALAAVPVAGARTPAADAGLAHLQKVPFGELPDAVQDRLWQVETDCKAPADAIRPNTFAYALDVNGKFRTDFIHVPGQGIKSWPNGWGGYCGANGTWLILWVAKDNGGYDEVSLGSTVAVLKSSRDFIFTTWCSGSMADPSISLAVLDRDTNKLAPFGRCYGSIERALVAARQMGYRVVSFRD